MKNCKPCITIRTFFFLLKKNYYQFRRDLKEYSYINKVSCEIPKPLPMEMPEDRVVKEIRKLAQDNYKPDPLFDESKA